MIPNINQFTEQLRMMPDQALQRVAQMYKQDPYILPMVIAEDMARKKMRMAAQAQTAQPQPKVADQAIMSMGQQPQAAPGIAALQAPNMQNMADGGIAGYADGGDTNFADRSEPVVRMAGGGAVQRFDDGGSTTLPVLRTLENILSINPDFDEQGLPRTRQESASIRARQEEARVKKQQIEDSAVGMNLPPREYQQRMEQFYRPRREYPAGQTAAKAAPAVAAPAAASALREPPLVNPEVGPGQPYSLGAAPSSSTLPSPPPEPSAAQTALQALSAPVTAPRSSIYDLTNPATARSVAQTLAPTNKYETALNVQTQRELERLEGREAERERNKPTGKAREGLEALLKQEGEGAAKEKSDAGAFALISAGLAIASGESPNALMNIAKGLNVGAKEYQAAIKDLKKADRERKLMLADIGEARRLEAKGDYEKAEERKDRVEDRRSSIERYSLSGIMQLGISENQLTSSLFGKGVEAAARRDLSAMEIGAANRRAIADLLSRRELASMPGQQERIIERLGEGDFNKGYQRFRQEGQSPTLFANYEKMAADTTLNPLTGKTKGREFLAKYPTFDAYMSAFEAQQGGGGRGPSAVSSDPLGIRQ
jgi:hypothetical protein